MKENDEELLKNIHVALATDEFYLKQTCIAIESILMASKKSNTYYYIYILMPDNDNDNENGNVYFNEIREKYLNCNIEVLKINESFCKASIQIEHITVPTYYRLLLPALIKQKKCLYLDSDIIVLDDLSVLYNIDIEGYDLGGVIAPMQHQMKNSGEFAKKIGIPSLSQYINAGVLLCNLEEMRKDKFTEKALKLIEVPFPTQDQDIINRVAYGKIKLLSYKFNVQVSREKYLGIFSTQERTEARENPTILHYSDMEKPWEYLDVEQSDRWWLICKKSILFDAFCEEQKNNLIYYGVIRNLRLWRLDKFSLEWIEEIKRYKKRYIYGAGIKGERALSYFKEYDIPVSGILVSELDGNKRNVQGIEVKKISREVENYALIFVATAKKYQVQIKKLLLEYGVFYIMPFYEI